MTPADIIREAEEVRALGTDINPAHLDAAPLVEVLFHGLGDGDIEAPPMLSLLRAIRLDVRMLLAYVESAGEEYGATDQAVTALGRKVDVAIELLRRIEAARQEDAR